MKGLIYINIDEKLILARLNDKIKACKNKNKIEYTEFLSKYKVEIIQKELNRLGEKNYIFYGGFDEAEYKVLILYPDKLKNAFEDFKNGYKEEYGLSTAEKSINNIIKAIRIVLPKELRGTYEHRDYLSAVMKFGLVRDRMGDIVSYDNGADIIILKENAAYVCESLKELTRFKKSEIKIININDIIKKEKEFEEFKITISSNRLDNYIAEIAKISRSQAEEMLEDERISLNSKIETKQSKEIKEKDIIIIRGKGKFIVDEFLGNNRRDKMVVKILKYI